MKTYWGSGGIAPC